jgi:hypothetical protein
LSADLSAPWLTPISCAAHAIWSAVKVPHAGLPGVGVGVGVGVGFGVGLADGFGDGAAGRAGGVGETDGDGLGEGDDGVDVGGWAGEPDEVVGAGLSITTTCGGGGPNGGSVADGLTIGDADDDDADDDAAVGEPDDPPWPEAELFGTTMSGVVPGVVVTRNPPPGAVATLRWVGEMALDPITTTLAVAAEVTPASSAAVTTVLVEVAASAEGSLNSAKSFMPATSPWALWTSG